MSTENPNIEETYAEVVETQDSDYSPLDAPVKQRGYTKHKVPTDQQFTILEEPSFDPPSFDELEEEEAADQGATNPKGNNANFGNEKRVFNEEFSELDEKEKKMGAEMMAEMTLDIYSKGCGFLRKFPEISDKKLDKLIAEGEIDPNIMLQTESGNLPVREFAHEYNDSIKDAFAVTDEFKDQVRPPLIRVFKKRGVGMTDEQLLMYYFGQDIAVKGFQAFALRKTANSILDSLKVNTELLKRQNTPQPQPTPPPVQPQPTQERKEDLVDVAEFAEKEIPVRKIKVDGPIGEALQFHEPEEGDHVFANLKGEGEGFANDYVAPAGMPNFGDVEILQNLEKMSNEPNQVPKRTRKPRKQKK